VGIKDTLSVESLDRIAELLIKYIEVRSELIKIQIKEQIAQILSKLILMFIFLLFGFLIIIIFSFAVSLYLNEILHSNYLGFVILTCFYLIVFVILVLNRKKIIRSVVLKALSEEHFDSNIKS